MKKPLFPILLAGSLLFIAVQALAAEEPTSELGKKLFVNPGLGGSQNAISCNTCHPDGEGLEKAGQRTDLVQMINQCIVGPLKGQSLTEDTVAMQSLKLYIESLAK